jgi:hypothetical protein
VESAPEALVSAGDKLPVYSPNQIFAGAFLGGPVTLVYFLHRNFKTLGNPRAARHCLWWGIFFNVLLLIAIPFIPDRVPHYIIPLIYSWAGYLIADRTQLSKAAIKAWAQYKFQSNRKVLGLSLAFIVATLLIWLAALTALDHFGIIQLPS